MPSFACPPDRRQINTKSYVNFRNNPRSWEALHGSDSGTLKLQPTRGHYLSRQIAETGGQSSSELSFEHVPNFETEIGTQISKMRRFIRETVWFHILQRTVWGHFISFKRILIKLSIATLNTLFSVGLFIYFFKISIFTLPQLTIPRNS